MSKYNAKRSMDSYVKACPTSVDGHNFPSKLHASVYGVLKTMMLAGEISNIRCEVSIPIAGKLKLKVDFVVFNIRRCVDEAHESKGYRDKRYNAIEQAWFDTAPMDLIVWEGSYLRPKISKVIKGKNGL